MCWRVPMKSEEEYIQQQTSFTARSCMKITRKSFLNELKWIRRCSNCWIFLSSFSAWCQFFSYLSLFPSWWVFSRTCEVEIVIPRSYYHQQVIVVEIKTLTEGFLSIWSPSLLISLMICLFLWTAAQQPSPFYLNHSPPHVSLHGDDSCSPTALKILSLILPLSPQWLDCVWRKLQEGSTAWDVESLIFLQTRESFFQWHHLIQIISLNN